MYSIYAMHKSALLVYKCIEKLLYITSADQGLPALRQVYPDGRMNLTQRIIYGGRSRRQWKK